MSCYGCPFTPKGGLDADAHARWLVGWRVDGVGEPGLCHRYRGIQQQQQQQQLVGRWLVGCSVIFHGNVLRVPREQLQFPGHQCFFSGVRFRRGLFIGHRSIGGRVTSVMLETLPLLRIDPVEPAFERTQFGRACPELDLPWMLLAERKA